MSLPNTLFTRRLWDRIYVSGSLLPTNDTLHEKYSNEMSCFNDYDLKRQTNPARNVLAAEGGVFRKKEWHGGSCVGLGYVRITHPAGKTRPHWRELERYF